MGPAELLPAALVVLQAVTPTLGSLPTGAFLVQTAGWEFKEGGPPDDDLISAEATSSECDCMTNCLVKEDCLSYSYGSNICSLFNRRGNVYSRRLGAGRAPAVRYRRDMAFLGDWCSSDRDCQLLTSGVATCQGNTCSCPKGKFPRDRTTCGTERPAVTTEQQPTTRITTQSSTSDTSTESSTQVEPATAGSRTTTTATTTETPTEPASNAKYISMVQTTKEFKQDKQIYFLDCTENAVQNNVLVGIADYRDMKDLDVVLCASYTQLPRLAVGTAIQVVMTQKPLNCAPGSIVVGVGDDDYLFREPNVMLCASVLPPYEVDANDCTDITVTTSRDWVIDKSHTSTTSKWQSKCPQLPEAVGITQLKYDRSNSKQHWFGMTCCMIKPMKPVGQETPQP